MTPGMINTSSALIAPTAPTPETFRPTRKFMPVGFEGVSTPVTTTLPAKSKYIAEPLGWFRKLVRWAVWQNVRVLQVITKWIYASNTNQ